MCEIDWLMVKEYIALVFDLFKAILSGPPMAAVTLILIFTYFKDDIKELIKRVEHGKWGNNELKFQSTQPPVTLPLSLKNDPIALDELAKAKADIGAYVEQHKRITIELNFERIFARLFGTQFKLLVHMFNEGGKANVFIIDSIFQEHKTLSQRTDSYTSKQFCDYLIQCRLIEPEQNDTVMYPYSLTSDGWDFVKYILENHGAAWRFNKPY